MDDDAFAYLIPQRDRVIGGGTKYVVQHDDDLATARVPSDDYIAEVQAKLAKLCPQGFGAAMDKAEARMGSRPIRADGRVLTAVLEDQRLPGLVLGGAGGSGWTFSVGIANEAAAFVCDRLGRGSSAPLVDPAPPRAFDRRTGIERRVTQLLFEGRDRRSIRDRRSGRDRRSRSRVG